MKTSPQIVHAAADSPRMEDCADVTAGERCYTCGGEVTRGVAREDWMGVTFVGQNRARIPSAEHVCEACVFVCSRTSPVPGRPPKEGKTLGGNFRNYSHVHDERGYCNFSKGEKPALLEWLRGPHFGSWFAAIAESGQKHTLTTCPVNPPGTRRGRVQFEEREVTLPMAAGWVIVEHMAQLLTAGATKEEIGRGDYGPRAWGLCAERIRRFEESWGAKRGGAWFELALYLAQRDEEAVTARLTEEKAAKKPRKGKGNEARRANTGGAEQGDGGRADGRAEDGAPAGHVAAQAVGPAAIADAGRGEDVREPGGVVDQAPARPPDRGPVQGAFAFDPPAPVGDGGKRARVARPRRA